MLFLVSQKCKLNLFSVCLFVLLLRLHLMTSPWTSSIKWENQELWVAASELTFKCSGNTPANCTGHGVLHNTPIFLSYSIAVQCCSNANVKQTQTADKQVDMLTCFRNLLWRIFVFFHGYTEVEASLLKLHCCEDNHEWEFCLRHWSIGKVFSYNCSFGCVCASPASQNAKRHCSVTEKWSPAEIF